MILRAREGSNFLPWRRFVTYENMEFGNWKRFYLLHLSFAVLRMNPMCWVDRVMGSQTTDSLESQNSVVGAQERRKGEGLWARPRVKTGPRSASDATAFFKSRKKNTSLWRCFGEEGLERPQIRQLSRMLIARPLRIMKTVLVPGSNSTRIFSFTDDVVSTGKQLWRFKAANRLHLQGPAVQKDIA